MKKITFWIFVLFGYFQMQGQMFTIQTCSGTSSSATYGPMNSVAVANATSREAVVYQSSMLTMLAGENLSSAYFNRSTVTGTMGGYGNFKIYLKEVAFNDFGAGALNWAGAIDGAVLVYDSNPANDVGTTSGWKSFPFTTNFLYSGTQNLAVFFEYSNTAASTYISWSYEFTSPCVNIANNNSTKYANTTTGILSSSLGSSSFRRPVIGFDFAVTCAAPTNVVVSDITSVNADFEWTAGGTETQWEYAVVPAGSAIPTSGTIVSTDELINLPLSPGTSYEMYVRAFCTSDDQSFWTVSNVFTTHCTAVAALYENFDSYATGTTSLPPCWDKIGNGYAYVNTGGALPGSAPNRLYMSTIGEGFVNAILPPFNNLSNNSNRLRFKAYATAANKNLLIGYQMDLLDASTFVLLESIDLPSTTAGSAEEFIIQPIGVPVEVENLVIRCANGVSTAMYIDDLVWESVPTCPDATELSYSNVMDTTATISCWLEVDIAGWQYAIGSADLLEPSSLNPIDVTGVGTVDLTNLTPSTAYKVWIRSNCAGDDFGAWIGPMEFTTQCTAVTDFYENFDSSLTGAVAPFTNCWKELGNGAVYIDTGGASPGTAPNRLYMSANGMATNPTVAYVLTPLVSNLQANTHRLKFKAYCSTANKTLEVGYFDDLLDIDSFITLETFNLPSTTAGSALQFSTIPMNVPVGIGNLVFRNSASTGSAVIYIDDVVWEPIPACSDIGAIHVSTFNSSSVTLSWEAGGSETDWQYVYGDINATNPTTLMGTLTDVASNPATVIGGLLPETSYKIWIRSKCGEGLFGNWPQIPTVIRTTCAPITEFEENFDLLATGNNNPLPACWTKFGTTGTAYIASSSLAPNSAPNRLYLSGTSANKVVVVMPPVSNLQTGTHRLKFKAYSTAANREIEIGYYNNTAEASSFQVLESYLLPSSAQANTQEFVYIAESIPAGIESLAFRNNSSFYTGATAIYIDDVVWEPLPPCFDISTSEVSTITSTSVNLGWNAGGTEAAWQYVYAESTVTDPTTLTPIDVATNPLAVLNNLTSNTDYNYWLRSNCGNGVYGDWSSIFTFKTDCAEVTTFYENFDSYATGSTKPLPDCWKKSGTGSVYISAGSATPGSTPNRLYMNASGSTGTQALAIMPSVSNLHAGTHRLKFKAYASALDRFLEVGYLSETAEGTVFTTLQTYALPGSTASTAASFTYMPTAIPVEVNKLAFRNVGIMDGATTAYIDDVTWEVSPNCPDVNPVLYAGITSNSVTISWATGGSESAWEYVYGVDSVTDPSTLTPVAVSNVPTATIASLLPATTYKVWVRSTCGADFGAWSIPVSFTTACSSSSLPFIENFASFLPNCWTTSSAGTIATGPTATSGGYWAADGFLNSGTTGAARININSLNRTSWLISAPLDLSAGGNYTFSFDYGITAITGSAAVNMGSDDTVQVAVSQDAGLTWTEIQLFNSTSAIGNTTQTYSYTFASTSANVKFAVIANDGTVDDLENYNFYVDNVKVDVALGNAIFDATSLTTYPNPVINTLNLSSTQEISDVKVFNLLGQEVMHTTINATKGQVNMSGLVSGAYLVKIITEKGIKTIKVVKQ